MEAALKMSRQFFYEKNKQTSRKYFIAREGSYHGNTLGSLAVSGFPARRAPYEAFLMDNVKHITSCNAYRQREKDESDAQFVARKAAELDDTFHQLGSDNVIGFIAEPVVGAALGCVPYVPGYLKAMRGICHKYGALFILDEVMCGMGRTGTLHAWQAENVVPDIQTIGKGLGAGYQPIAAMLINKRVLKVLEENTGQFIHGQTYQAMPVQAAAALEVQRIIREEHLLANVLKQGTLLGELLKGILDYHPNVGDIRGQGLFWGIEFVKNKVTKEPFDLAQAIAQKIHHSALEYGITVYPGTGTFNGISGDHVLIAPSFYVTKKDVDIIADRVCTAIVAVFSSI